MPNTDPRIDAYIEAAAPFARPILTRVRKAFHAGCPDVIETIKWSSPCFEHHGMLGTMAAFKAHVSYGFWKAKQLDDPQGILDLAGSSQMSRTRAEKLSDVPSQKVLADYVRRAAALNSATKTKKAAKKPRAKRAAPSTPDDLAAALAKNKKARAFFEGLPPSGKREYVEWITEAKREATRKKRLDTTIEWLSEGKRKNWKYENC